MTRLSKRIAIAVTAMVVGGVGLELGEALSVPGLYGPISSAEAVVGRPLTPVSVAGVGRRTARRCAVGVYNC